MMRRLLVIAPVLVMTACGPAEDLGLTSVCYATSDDSPADDDNFQIDEARSGLRLATEDEELGPPSGFEACAAGMAAKAELIDSDGVHVFIGIEARYGIRDLVQATHFALLDGGDLRISQVGGGLSPPSTTLFMANGDQPIVALQQSGDPTEQDFGVLGVEIEGELALPKLGTCGSADHKNVRFVDDNGGKTSSEGDTVELIVGGVEFSGTNISALETTSVSCTDSGGTGIKASWIAANNAI